MARLPEAYAQETTIPATEPATDSEVVRMLRDNPEAAQQAVFPTSPVARDDRTFVDLVTQQTIQGPGIPR